MKTKKMTPASSLGKELNFTFPKSWAELTQKQLKAVLVFLSTYPATTALVRITCYFANLVILRKVGNGQFCCRLATSSGVHTIVVSSVEVAAMTEALEWVLQPGDTPVLLEELYGRKSIDVELHGVDFETYIALENLYQGYLMSNDEKAVCEMANLIYSRPGVRNDWPDDSEDAVQSQIDSLKPFELFSICQWFTQVKALFAKSFPNFFRPASGSSECSMVDIMNAEILALTGGDITKEDEVLRKDTWRALTYLDAKAKEAEDFRKSMNK